MARTCNNNTKIKPHITNIEKEKHKYITENGPHCAQKTELCRTELKMIQNNGDVEQIINFLYLYIYNQ